ncbi:MAG TPA: histidine phosphatase family protein [Acidimicrobiia bacterium]|nr:histidine phosphatase family protein [Acidimicrobiia bacterium]
MARLLLIRHAPTAETGARLTGRLPGVGLHDEGREVAERTAARLADVKLKAVYASPIERTWETAEIVARPHRLTPVADAGLIEVDYGAWSGRSLKSLYRLKAWRTVQVTPSRMTFPDGEALADAQRRAVATCERLAADHGNDTVALVSHSDVIQSIISHYLGQPLDLFARIVISAGSVSVIDVPRQGVPTVVAINGTGTEGSWR